jgi:hypothetical protein
LYFLHTGVKRDSISYRLLANALASIRGLVRVK